MSSNNSTLKNYYPTQQQLSDIMSDLGLIKNPVHTTFALYNTSHIPSPSPVIVKNTLDGTTKAALQATNTLQLHAETNPYTRTVSAGIGIAGKDGNKICITKTLTDATIKLSRENQEADSEVYIKSNGENLTVGINKSFS
jgi:hypothetical protein